MEKYSRFSLNIAESNDSDVDTQNNSWNSLEDNLYILINVKLY